MRDHVFLSAFSQSDEIVLPAPIQLRIISEVTSPSSLAFHLWEWDACLVPLRTSNEHTLIVRVPGVKDQHAYHSFPRFHLILHPMLAF
jgi:hypothetical protein